MSVVRLLLAAAALVLLAGCASATTTTTQPGSAYSTQATRATAPAAAPRAAAPRASLAPTAATPMLRQVHDPGHVTGTLTGPCHLRDNGQLPDPRCTPGSYDPDIPAAVLCARDARGRFTYRTGDYRPPVPETARFKRAAFDAYGLPRIPGMRSELDHLVALLIGGSNDASNLWIELGKIPNPKDRVEDRLHAWVCAADGAAAQQRLNAAQVAIASNWMTAERVLGIKGGTT